MHPQNPFTWRRFEAEIMLLCLRWYLRYPASLSPPRRNDGRAEAEGRSHHHLSLGPVLRTRIGPALPTASESHHRFSGQGSCKEWKRGTAEDRSRSSPACLEGPPAC